METQNLWPDFVIDKTKSPKAILKEQAGYLMVKTNNVLSAEIETTQEFGQIVHHFYVVAPAINNYRYKLFSVSHKIVEYYPLTVMTDIELDDEPFENHKVARDEKELISLLSGIFNNSENTRIISSLLSQSLAE
ncbi:hypothetical protein [Spirosoma foliorum]|uniref:Uncharacterized protein n=1 Tax=Spirosoma foliorum TaxID=2710596 RepID=A0A7G5GW04_9BACT|nr:hypothetical protein [Spirosoma foliorum]QMW03046.1 hypothetical protein H3H32_35065 [Spirosoma foliorum]